VRVGIVASFYPEIRGGAEVGLAAVLEALQGGGIDLVVYTLGDGAPLRGERLVPLRVLPHRLRRATLAGPPGFDRVAAMRLRRAIAAQPPSLLHAWDSYATPAVAAASSPAVPFVATYHNNVGIPHRVLGAPRGVAAWLDRRERRILAAASRARTVVGISAYVAAELTAAGLPRVGAIHVDGVVSPVVSRVEPPAGGPLAVLAAGRLQEHKGFATAIRAVATLRARGVDARLTVVGWGPHEGALRRLADEVGAPDVAFAGRRHADEMAAAFDAADVVVVPTLTPEPFGRVAVEAFARGRPVVASAIGGLAEIVADGRTGALVPPGDAELLAAALERFARDRDFAAGAGRAALADASARFSASVVVGQLVDVYREATRT
jgi:glycosyltransferase involved in cell wall biosynthesis